MGPFMHEQHHRIENFTFRMPRNFKRNSGIENRCQIPVPHHNSFSKTNKYLYNSNTYRNNQVTSNQPNDIPGSTTHNQKANPRDVWTRGLTKLIVWTSAIF